MNELYTDIVNKINIGLIILDSNEKIVLWNKYMEKLTKKSDGSVIDHAISEICPRFSLTNYNTIIKNAIESGQSRFLSGAVHGAFFESDMNTDMLKQNIHIEPININGVLFVLIQVTDVTSQYQKVKQMKSFIKNLETENSEIRQTEEEARNLALHDMLTGLPNRLHLMRYMSSMTANPADEDELSAVIFLDLDDFKSINDTYGHSVGDELLKSTAKRLKESVRCSDFVARLSGDEFILILNKIRTKEMAIVISNKIKEKFSTPFNIDGQMLRVSCSFGISLFPQDSTDPESLLNEADKALYSVKHSGKSGYAFYDRVK